MFCSHAHWSVADPFESPVKKLWSFRFGPYWICNHVVAHVAFRGLTFRKADKLFKLENKHMYRMHIFRTWIKCACLRWLVVAGRPIYVRADDQAHPNVTHIMIGLCVLTFLSWPTTIESSSLVRILGKSFWPKRIRTIPVTGSLLHEHQTPATVCGPTDSETWQLWACFYFSFDKHFKLIFGGFILLT